MLCSIAPRIQSSVSTLFSLLFLTAHLSAAAPAPGEMPAKLSELKLSELKLSELKLGELNENWAGRTPNLALVAETVSGEVALIQTHLLLVIDQLEQANVAHLSAAQLAERLANINRLKTYASAGEFPQNVFVPGRRPVFIDPWGTHCAVGHLIKTSGHGELAKAINREHQLDYLRDIKTGGLGEWQTASGLSVDELALIQPSYDFRHRPSKLLSYPKAIEALILGDSEAIRKAIQSKEISVNARCGGKTLLHFAAATGDLELVQFLVAKGADLQALSTEGCDEAALQQAGKKMKLEVRWNEETLVTPRPYGGLAVFGPALETLRGKFVAGVLRDFNGGIAGKNALFFATANPTRKGWGGAIISWSGVSVATSKGKKSPQQLMMEELREQRAAVAKWLQEQGLK